jgi:hypothetical protein
MRALALPLALLPLALLPLALRARITGGGQCEAHCRQRACAYTTSTRGHAGPLLACVTCHARRNRAPTQDVYKYVTHEKGLLGSQGAYNARHRRLCAPPFRSRVQLARFAGVVVQR